MASPTNRLPLLLLLGIMLSSHLVLADPEPGLRLSRLPPISITDPDRAGLVSFTGGKGFYKHMAREFLVTHNQVRGNLGEPPYLWDRALARYARRWLQKHRADCAIAHSGGPYGENLFWGSGWSWRAAEAVSSWASERFNYNRADNTCLPGKMCGHFTQIVWNSSVKVGCARMECYDGGVIMACNYDPPGNYIGESPFGS